MSEVKVGDVVVFTGESYDFFGKIGVVENCDDDFGDKFWIVSFGDDLYTTWHSDNFEVIDNIESIAAIQDELDSYTSPFKVGDKVKYIGNDFWEIEEQIGTIVEVDPELTEDLIQFNDGKKYSIDRKCLVKDNSIDIKSYPIEDLIQWRNSASQRVTKADDDIKYFMNCMEDLNTKLNRIEKKRLKDAIWISKLNNILYKKVIKDRK